MHSVVRHQMLFTLGMLSCGLLQALAAFVWVGVHGVEGVSYSILLCLIPGWLTIYSSDLIKNKELAVYSILFGTGLRMTFVLLGMFSLSSIRPDLGFREFTIWLIPSYLIALGIETSILLTPTLASAFRRTDA